MSLLSIQDLSVSYGAIEALRGVSLEVQEGEVVALIGANGAGKSTLLMSLFGMPAARSGSILFAGQSLIGLPAEKVARLGLTLVPEGRRIFARMTVAENLQLGAEGTPAKILANELEKIFALFPRLKERYAQRAGTLSGGEQQMLAIGRGLMARPRLLLMDEPSLGLAPLLVKQIFEAIARLNREQKCTIFLVEQNAHQALRLAHRGYVLVNGKVTLSGAGKELLSKPEIRAAYLEGASA